MPAKISSIGSVLQKVTLTEATQLSSRVRKVGIRFLCIGSLRRFYRCSVYETEGNEMFMQWIKFLTYLETSKWSIIFPCLMTSKVTEGLDVTHLQQFIRKLLDFQTYPVWNKRYHVWI